MTVDEFWAVIARSRTDLDHENPDENQDRQVAALRAELEKLGPEEIFEFRENFESKMNDAYSWDVRAAAYVLAKGCSDDAFVDFRSMLISMGREVFEIGLKDPDSLHKLRDDGTVEDIFFEEFLYVPDEAYESVAGRSMPESQTPHLTKLVGSRWKDDEELERTLPKTWVRARQ